MINEKIEKKDSQNKGITRIITITTRGRLDSELAAELKDLSRSRIQTLIRSGNCCLNDSIVTKTGIGVVPGDIVTLNIPATIPAKIEPEDIPLDVIFEDENVLVINKAAGIVVHPSAGHDQGTIVNAAIAHAPLFKGINGELRPGIVHRLDKDTSGLLIIAKNDMSQRWLQAQFKNRELEKIYIALVDGFPATNTGRIEAPIYRDPRNRKRMAIAPEGKGRVAITEFKVIQKYDKHSLLEVNLLTGRTHQIRVHLAALKIPIAGDSLYGYRNPSIPINRHFLHAQKLKIRLPRQKSHVTFVAPLPPELEFILSQLRS